MSLKMLQLMKALLKDSHNLLRHVSPLLALSHTKKNNNFRACKSSAQGWFTRVCRLCNLTLDVQEKLSCKLCSYDCITITLTQHIM